MVKSISSFEAEMKHTGIVTLKDVCDITLQLLQRIKQLEEENKETKEIITQLTNDLNRISGPDIQ